MSTSKGWEPELIRGKSYGNKKEMKTYWYQCKKCGKEFSYDEPKRTKLQTAGDIIVMILGAGTSPYFAIPRDRHFCPYCYSNLKKRIKK